MQVLSGAMEDVRRQVWKEREKKINGGPKMTVQEEAKNGWNMDTARGEQAAGTKLGSRRSAQEDEQIRWL